MIALIFGVELHYLAVCSTSWMAWWESLNQCALTKKSKNDGNQFKTTPLHSRDNLPFTFQKGLSMSSQWILNVCVVWCSIVALKWLNHFQFKFQRVNLATGFIYKKLSISTNYTHAKLVLISSKYYAKEVSPSVTCFAFLCWFVLNSYQRLLFAISPLCD